MSYAVYLVKSTVNGKTIAGGNLEENAERLVTAMNRHAGYDVVTLEAVPMNPKYAGSARLDELVSLATEGHAQTVPSVETSRRTVDTVRPATRGAFPARAPKLARLRLSSV